MTRPDSCAIAVVLDRSGSMRSIRDATIEGFNEFLAAQKAVPGEAALTLAQFDHEYDIVHDAAPLANVEPLNTTTYVPRGSTALLDAIGRTIDGLGKRLAAMPEHNRPSRIIVAIMTDGLENASQTFTRARIFEMITHQRERYSWQFMFLGADQDAIAIGRDYGIDPRFAAMFSRELSSKSLGVLSDKLRVARMSGMPMEEFSVMERREMVGDEPAASAPKPPSIRKQRRNGSQPRTPQAS